MNSDFPKKTKRKLMSLYNQGGATCRVLQWMAARERDATNTSADLVMRKFRIARSEAITVLRGLAEAGCGDFVVGRRGSPSRIQWAYSCISLGRAASGENIEIEHVSMDALGWDEDDGSFVDDLTVSSAIDQAKQIIAQALGALPSDIDLQFSVRG